MKKLARRLCATALLLAAAHVAAQTPVAASAQPYKKSAGPHPVEVLDVDWTDTARNRVAPARIYYPKDARDPCPVIVFSHGLGGSREGYEYLGRHWAGYGYVSVHLQHKGSDTEVWKGNERPMEAMRQSAADPQNAINRPLDVRFALDQLTRMNGEAGPLKGLLDMDRVGMAGHSFGAYTTLAVAGEVFFTRAGRAAALAEPRIKAAIPMSAPAPRDRARLDEAFAQITIPCLHMTGTLDDSPIGDTKAAERRIPFDHIRGADQYLVTFTGGDHMIFSGHQRLRGGGEKDALFHDLIRMSTTAFWDAYLRDDASARKWLAEGGFAAVLGKDGVFEKKLTSGGRSGEQ